jgi:adenylate cyclase
VILGELGYRERFLLTAIGDAVHVASRLQELTKEYGCQAVVSEVVGETANIALVGMPRHEISVRGREAQLTVRVVSKVEQLSV